MSDSIKTQFEIATKKVRNSKPRKETTNSEKLKFYGLYKQATEGNNFKTEPWAFQFKEHAQWLAWKGFLGMTKEKAMKEYINETNKLFKPV